MASPLVDGEPIEERSDLLVVRVWWEMTADAGLRARLWITRMRPGEEDVVETVVLGSRERVREVMLQWLDGLRPT
jgi:hypothetical protein